MSAIRNRISRLEGSFASGGEVSLEMLIAISYGAPVPVDPAFAAAAARSPLVLMLCTYARNGATSH
jgi:hypothetical protein